MRFFTPLLAAGLASVALAAPTNITEEYSLSNGDVPYEAIIGGLTIPEDATPVVMDTNGTASLVFLNTTVLDSIPAKRRVNDVAKREAEADAGFHWIRLKWGQPIFKREAEADAEAEAEAGFHWIRLKWGQPIFKREAEAEADATPGFHWIRLKWGQPIFKREAEAEADATPGFHWIRLKWGQPIF